MRETFTRPQMNKISDRQLEDAGNGAGEIILSRKIMPIGQS